MHLPKAITRTALLILTSALLNSPTQANARWTAISLRIEGPNTTIFEDTIATEGNIVTTSSGGTHMCDGTNNGAHTSPGPTIISAIDDAVSTWDGTWDKKYRDYFITSIAGYSQTADKYWGLLVKYKFTKGGCQTQVAAGDQVLVAFDAFSPTGNKVFLEASANKQSIPRGDEIIFSVVDAFANRTPVKDAQVVANAGPKGTTGIDGRTTLRFEDVGVYKYKATKFGAIRSNEVVVTVTAPPAPPPPLETNMAGVESQTAYLYDSGFRGCNQ